MPRDRTRLLVATMIATLVAMAQLAADRPWKEIRGRNVVVFGQQSPGTLRDVAVQIEQFHIVLDKLIAGPKQPQSIPTEVYLFDNARAIQDYVPLYQGRPAALDGYCHCGAPDEISVIVASLSNYSESSSIIYHEYTHLLTRNTLGDVPVWLNEGLAEYFSTFTLRSGGREAEVGAPIAHHIAALRDDFVPLPQLLAVNRESPLYNERTRKTIFYAEAWALTHYLLAGRPGGAETLNAFLAEYRSGTDGGAALVKATGVPLQTIERDLRGYVIRPLALAMASGFNGATVSLGERVIVDAPGAARTLPVAEAEARLGEIQMRVDRPAEAMKRIEAASASAPDDPQVQLVLARLRLRQDRGVEAMTLLRRVAAQAPNDFAAQYLYALTLLRGDGDISSATWPTDRAREARTALARAVALRPESAAALAWLGYADEQEGTHLEEAREMTTRAVALAPGRADYARQLEDIETQLKESARASVATAAPAAAPAADALRQPQDLRGVTYRLRETGTGEQRVFGELIEIACGATGVRFRLNVDGQELAAPAKRIEDVELTSFGSSAGHTVRCGARVPHDKVYLTRDSTGSVVAVEFMPDDYRP